MGECSIIDFAVTEFNERAVIALTAVEVVDVETMGAPGGRILDVAAAWQDLKDQGCLAILGPHISDTCIELRPVVDAGQVPRPSRRAAPPNSWGSTHSECSGPTCRSKATSSRATAWSTATNESR